MTPAHIWDAIPRPKWRLLAGLSASIVVHLWVIVTVTPTPYRYVQPRPLVVELLRESVLQASDDVLRRSPAEVEASGPLVIQAPSPGYADTAQSTPFEPPPRPRVEPPAKRVAAQEPKTTVGERSAPGLDIPADKYFTLREVDVRPEQINEVELLYPRRAYALRTRGKVLLQIFISSEGTVDEVNIVEATPAGVFEEAALEAVLALKFTPAVRAGRYVKVQKTIEVTFNPYERINIP